MREIHIVSEKTQTLERRVQALHFTNSTVNESIVSMKSVLESQCKSQLDMNVKIEGRFKEVLTNSRQTELKSEKDIKILE